MENERFPRKYLSLFQIILNPVMKQFSQDSLLRYRFDG